MSTPLDEIVELHVPPDSKYIAVVRLTVAGVASRAGMSVDDVDDLKVAVSEVFTNTVDHAFDGIDPKPVTVRMMPTDTELTVEVTDEGVGFEPDDEDFQLDDSVSGDGGLGLYLVNQYMDDVRIESAPGSGTKVIMTKRLAR